MQIGHAPSRPRPSPAGAPGPVGRSLAPTLIPSRFAPPATRRTPPTTRQCRRQVPTAPRDRTPTFFRIPRRRLKLPADLADNEFCQCTLLRARGVAVPPPATPLTFLLRTTPEKNPSRAPAGFVVPAGGSRPRGVARYLTSILRGLARSLLGRRTVSTPLVWVASMWSSSTALGSRTSRRNDPRRRSTW